MLLKRAKELSPGEIDICISGDDVIETIVRRCSISIGASNASKRFLFRGVEQQCEYFLGIPRLDRRPRDTPPVVHAGFVEWLGNKGFKANRNNSLFTSSSYGAAKGYTLENGGEVFAIFPFDGFDFTWARNCSDLFAEWAAATGEDITKPLEPFLEGIDFVSTDLEAALLSENEILCASAPYVAVRADLLGTVGARIGLPWACQKPWESSPIVTRRPRPTP